MKRVSKRELMMRFPEGLTVRAEVLDLGRRTGRVRVDGVECVLSYPGTQLGTHRDALLARSRLDATTLSAPAPLNTGWFARATVPPDRRVVGNGRSASMPTLMFNDPALTPSRAPLLAYIEAHPVGSIVWAEVLRRCRTRVTLQLLGGPQATLDAGACHDQTPGEPLKGLALPEPGQRLRVVVRQYRHSKPQGLRIVAAVSVHSWQRDQGFCNQEAGYKNRFDIERSHFAYLPWERPKT